MVLIHSEFKRNMIRWNYLKVWEQNEYFQKLHTFPSVKAPTRDGTINPGIVANIFVIPISTPKKFFC